MAVPSTHSCSQKKGYLQCEFFFLGIIKYFDSKRSSSEHCCVRQDTSVTRVGCFNCRNVALSQKKEATNSLHFLAPMNFCVIK
jgi:hypothetical protein